MMTAPLASLMLAVTALLLSQSALAGSMSFGLSVTGTELTLINQGNGSAFYPAVFRMLPNGSWAQLEARSAPAELAAGARMELNWPEPRSPEQASELDSMGPVMVRFFDQAGVGFGQISFFSAPPAAKTALKAGYVDGALQIEPPEAAASIRVSWVLWPQEEGIRPIRLPVRFEHGPPPPALRIDWQRQGRVPFQLATGAGQPAAILIHESDQGYVLQHVPGGGLQGREQRAVWLDATPKLYSAALIALAIGVLAMAAQLLLPLLRRPRTQVRADSAKPGSADAGGIKPRSARTGNARRGRAKTGRARG